MSTESASAVATPSRGDVKAATDRSWHRRRWLLGAGGLLLATALAVAMTLGATYQPVTYGDGAVAVQGALNLRTVNDFGIMQGQSYLPPQPANHGDLIVSLANTGPYPVTIESVSMPLYPNALNQPTGPATYVPLTGKNPQVANSSPKIDGASLRPGENILIRIPFRTPACWMSGWSVVRTFSVTTKFLWWTHTFDVSWTHPDDPNGGAIMSQIPDPNGGSGALCPHH